MTTGLCSCLRKTFHPTVRTKLNWAQWKKTWIGFLNKSAYFRNYLQERLHVLARTVANTCGFRCSALRWRLQCTAGKVALHCGEGCSALQGRLHCTVSWTDLSIPKCITRYWGDVSQWSENLNVMYRLTDYME